MGDPQLHTALEGLLDSEAPPDLEEAEVQPPGTVPGAFGIVPWLSAPAAQCRDSPVPPPGNSGLAETTSLIPFHRAFFLLVADGS